MCRCLNYVEYLIELNHYFFVFEYPTWIYLSRILCIKKQSLNLEQHYEDMSEEILFWNKLF